MANGLASMEFCRGFTDTVAVLVDEVCLNFHVILLGIWKKTTLKALHLEDFKALDH